MVPEWVAERIAGSGARQTHSCRRHRAPAVEPGHHPLTGSARLRRLRAAGERDRATDLSGRHLFRVPGTVRAGAPLITGRDSRETPVVGGLVGIVEIVGWGRFATR